MFPKSGAVDAYLRSRDYRPANVIRLYCGTMSERTLVGYHNDEMEWIQGALPRAFQEAEAALSSGGGAGGQHTLSAAAAHFSSPLSSPRMTPVSSSADASSRRLDHVASSGGSSATTSALQQAVRDKALAQKRSFCIILDGHIHADTHDIITSIVDQRYPLLTTKESLRKPSNMIVIWETNTLQSVSPSFVGRWGLLAIGAQGSGHAGAARNSRARAVPDSRCARSDGSRPDDRGSDT